MKSSEVTIEPRGTGPSIGAGRYSFPVGPSTTTSGITMSPMPTRRSDPAGDADHHHAVEVAEAEQAFGRARRERGADTGRGRDDVGVADGSGVHGDTADLRRLQPERLHDRSQLRLHRREHADPNAITALPSSQLAAKPVGAAPCSTREPRLERAIGSTARRPLSLGPVSVVTRGRSPARSSRSSSRSRLRHATERHRRPRTRRARAGRRRAARAPRARAGPLRVVGVLTALIAAWLLPQRTDLAERGHPRRVLRRGRRPDVGPRPTIPTTGRARSAATAGDRAAGRGRRCSPRTSARRRRASHWFGGGITHGPTARRRGRAHLRRRTQPRPRRCRSCRSSTPPT